MKTVTQSITTMIARRPARPRRIPRHRLSRMVAPERTHPWFEQRAQRILELGSFR